MSKIRVDSLRFILVALAALVPAAAVAAGPAHKAWLENWQKKNPTWRALHLIWPKHAATAESG